MTLPTCDSEASPAGACGAPVLIVEDERVSRRALALLLNASGYPTETVSSAEEAMGAFERGHFPHVALVDLDLPGMSGLELIQRLAEMRPAVVPVMITAANNDTLLSALRARGVAYLRKPLDYDRLLVLLRKYFVAG